MTKDEVDEILYNVLDTLSMIPYSADIAALYIDRDFPSIILSSGIEEYAEVNRLRIESEKEISDIPSDSVFRKVQNAYHIDVIQYSETAAVENAGSGN